MPTSSGNNGGNKIKLWTRIEGRIARERENKSDQTTLVQDKARRERRIMREG